MLSKRKYLVIIGVIGVLVFTCTIFILNYSKNPLKGTSWSRKTDVDTEYINFYDNGDYSYYFAVGSPVDDSDLCEKYEYDDDSKIIILKCIDNSINNKIKIDYIDYNKLILIFDNEKRIFNKVNK